MLNPCSSQYFYLHLILFLHGKMYVLYPSTNITVNNQFQCTQTCFWPRSTLKRVSEILLKASTLAVWTTSPFPLTSNAVLCHQYVAICSIFNVHITKPCSFSLHSSTWRTPGSPFKSTQHVSIHLTLSVEWARVRWPPKKDMTRWRKKIWRRLRSCLHRRYVKFILRYF